MDTEIHAYQVSGNPIPGEGKFLPWREKIEFVRLCLVCIREAQLGYTDKYLPGRYTNSS
jgi:hypothetical protein